MLTSLIFQIILGHGVEDSLISDVNEQAKAFFLQPQENKQPYASKFYGDPEGGYTQLGVEAVARSNDGDMSLPPDLVESFLFPFPPALYQQPMIIPRAQEYYQRMLQLLGVLHAITAAALRIPLDFFNSHYSPLDAELLTKEVTGFYLRFAYYPPTTQASSEDDAAERYGAHTDYECYTILKADASDWVTEGARGLEVQLPEGSYIPVSVPADAFVINGGDLLQRWTNDKWRSAMHRVKKPVAGSVAAGVARQSIAFFTGTRGEVVIESMDHLNGPVKYAGISGAEHVRMKIERTVV